MLQTVIPDWGDAHVLLGKLLLEATISIVPGHLPDNLFQDRRNLNGIGF